MQTHPAHPVLDDRPDVPPAESLRPGEAWGPLKTLLFRFFFIYLVLHNFPAPLDYVPSAERAVVAYLRMWNPLVLWVAEHVFRVVVPVNGGWDTTFGYVRIFCFLVISAAAALIWTLLDRKRSGHARLYEWLRVYLRFVLAVAMIDYGAAKVFPSQFPAPTTDRLMQPFGDASPMGLLWTFMGASVPYNVFAGLGELAGGLLLTFRRTTLLGALICIGVMSNVVMLNFSYDVPVKVYSSHLLLMAVFLAAHDLRRLANLFVLNRPTEPEEIRPLFRRKGLARAAAALMAVFILYRTGTALYESHRAVVENGSKAPKPPLYGVWNVEELSVNGKIRPPLVTDGTRWRRVFFSAPGRFSIQLMSDSRERYNLVLDETKRTLDISKRSDPNWKTTLVYRRLKPDVLVVEGSFDGQEIQARLRRTEPPEFVLVTRGFHWINERPFNR